MKVMSDIALSRGFAMSEHFGKKIFKDKSNILLNIEEDGSYRLAYIIAPTLFMKTSKFYEFVDSDTFYRVYNDLKSFVDKLNSWNDMWEDDLS